MKKALCIALAVAACTAGHAQEVGRFEVHNFDNFRLHVYYTNDALGDASYIVEGQQGLVTMEQPLFKTNVAEFDAYLTRLAKPVVQRIADYHVGGTADHDYVMPQGMPAFVEGPIYGGMMQGFAQTFGDAIVALPTGKTGEVAFGSTQTYAGVSFRFGHGATTDFPGAAILIGGHVYYTHWAPAKAHTNALQIASREAITAKIAETEAALASGATLFIGGHGGAADKATAEFQLAYLRTMQQLLATCTTPEAYVAALTAAYPDLSGAEGLEAVAQALYQ